MSSIIRTLFFIVLFSPLCAQSVIHEEYGSPHEVPGLFKSPYFDEQVVTFNYSPDVSIHINAPSAETFNPQLPACIVLYALPNGNTIEQTVGKVLEPGDDWHFDIQHIGAQTRYLRERMSDYNLVIVYLEAEQKSWPAWNRKHENYKTVIVSMVDFIESIFSDYDPFFVLSGHSGGGRFIFSFIDAYGGIPNFVKRISFLDSNYGYDNEYGDKIVDWIKSSPDNFLNVFAYNDAVALYNGKPFVSDTGGTFYRSKMMMDYFSNHFKLHETEDTSFINVFALNYRIEFHLKKNPNREIFHTVQVERNGFIHSLLSGTKLSETDYKYFGGRVYDSLIQKNLKNVIPFLKIPPRKNDALLGSEFMKSVSELSFEEREAEIFKQIAEGNIPNFLRNQVTIQSNFTDSLGEENQLVYKVMPDYLSIGTDEDFCRIPMGPKTAQKIADLFGASLPTRKLVDDIYKHSAVKLEPVTYWPVENQNELVSKFVEHNEAIQKQFDSAGAKLGDLVGGIKKDVVISNKINDPSRPNHVVIYGWHKLDGKPIQPLTNIHIDWYVDYSHGIRLINKYILFDGELVTIDSLMNDLVLFTVISDEEKPMEQCFYPTD